MGRRDTNWIEILDLETSLKNVRTDIFGDWHRDPWGWPEHEWLLSEHGRSHVVQALDSEGIRRVATLDVPKENFATRPAVVFDPVDRLVYQALVDRISVKVIGPMPRWTFGWRLSRKSPVAGKYVTMSSEWNGYRNRLTLLSEIYPAALITDIVSCFPSIPIVRLTDLVCEVAGVSAVAERLGGLLAAWDQVNNRSGLPMRANASCVLASMYLRAVDDVLLAHGNTFAVRGSLFLRKSYALGQGTACRWVDDLWLFGDAQGDLRVAQLDLQDTIRTLGLHMNLAKTDVLEGEKMVARARQLEHSAVDIALMDVKPDFEPLNDLIDRLLVAPETANHTSVRFATVRMRRHKNYKRSHEFIAVAERMPHAGAALARLFHDSGCYRDLGSWFAAYVRSTWARMELAVAQLATMFPSGTAPERAVIDALCEKVVSGCSISLTSVTVQRLASWSPGEARTLIREVARSAESPHVRRVLAFAALNAGESRSWVDRLLAEFRENAVTRDYLKERNFNPVSAVADFSGQ